jgi:phosphate uptake regulator
VVPTSENAGQPPAGEATEPTTLEEAQTEEAPTEETVTAEAPKKRGRPALTEEQKAAKAATQQPKGKRGRKPLTEEQKAEKKKQNAPERATLAQIVRAVDKLTERIKNALTPVNEDAFETDEEVAQAEEDKRVERKDVIRELLKFDANPIVRGRPLHKRIKDLLNSPGITEQEKADIKKGMELVSKVNLREETLPAAGKAVSEPVDPAYSGITSGLKALFHIIRTGTAAQKAIANRLRSSIGNIRFTVVEEGDTVPDQLRSPKNAEQWARSRALYIENYKTKARSIFVRGASFGESQGANNTTVLHELLHGATNYKIALAKEYIDKGIHLNSRLVKSFERLIEIMNFAGYKFNELEAVDELPKEISALANYGEIFDDPREFVAYGMTDDRMQEFLKATEGFDEDTYLFPTFVQNIRSFFGIRESEVNALSDLILAVHNLMEAPEEATPLEDTSTQVSAQARRSAEEIDDAVRKAQITVEQSRAGEEARGVKLMQLARDPKQMLEIFPAMWDGAKNAQREVMVRLPTFDFLAKWMGKEVPMLNDMHKNLQNMTGMATKFLEGAEQIISALQKTFNAEPDQRRKVEDLVLQTTLARIDPSIVAAQERSPTLDAAYRALSPAGKEAYKLLREYYERVHDLYRLLLDDQISNLEGISDEAKARLMATIRLAYEGEGSIRPFFPLVRRGTFWVATGAGPSRQFFMFESRRERTKFAKQLRSVNANREVRVGDDINSLRTASRDASNMLKEFFDAIDSQDLTESDVKEGLKDAVYQIYLQTMPEQTFRKMFVHRKGIAGFSTDLVRNTATTASKMATQLSRLKYAPILRNNLTAARSLLADRPELTPVVREAQRRVESALSGREAGIADAVAGAANKLSYLWYLSSASSALLQPFSALSSGLWVLGANHGNVPGAAEEIGRMMTFINQYGITRRNLDGTLSYAAPSLANNEKLPDDEREAVRQMTERGVQDSTYSSLVWGYARTPNANLEGVVGKGKAAANLLVGGLMHHTERLTREALYLASYRLGKQRGLTSDEAIDQAVSDVNESLGDYSIENRPRWMQKGLGRIAFQFKMYPLQMTLLALTSLKQMFTHLDAEGRKAAAIKFFGLMGSSLMLAGASNMLFFSPIAGLIGWAWKEFGDDGDLPEELKDKDFETWFRTVFLPETFGHISIGNVTLADIIDRGPFNAITGWDIGSRIGLNDLWGRASKDAKTLRENVTTFVIDNFGGPTASLGLSMIDAYEAYALGDYQKAIEKATPSVIRNIVIANKYATEGVESSRGSGLVSKEALTKGELFGQAIGFRPDRVAAAQAAAFKGTGVIQRVTNERATLLDRLNIEHRKAQKTDNYDRFDAIIANELPKFNGKNPENAIDSDDIYNSILKRAELRASERAGIAITEKNARLMRESAENMEKLLERK